MAWLLLTVLIQVYAGRGQGNTQSRKMERVSSARKTSEFKIADKTAEKASEIVRLALLKGNCALCTDTTLPIRGSSENANSLGVGEKSE